MGKDLVVLDTQGTTHVWLAPRGTSSPPSCLEALVSLFPVRGS